MRRLGVAGVLLVLLAVVVGAAAADNTQKFSIGDVTVSEDAGTATFTISLSDGPDNATVTWGTANDSAVANQDYVPGGGTVNVAANGSTPVTVSIINEVPALDEPNERFFVNLSNPTTGATIEDGQATGTINDDDGPVAISIANAESGESGTMTFNVTLNAASGQTVKANWATTHGSADGSDYTPSNGTVTFSPGDTSESFGVPITPDSADESDETFTVNLSALEHAVAGDLAATGTIRDNDGPPRLDVTVAAVTEGAGQVFRVKPAAPSSQQMSATWKTEPDSPVSAVAGSDYTAQTAGATLTWPAGNTDEKTFTVQTTNDSVDEAAETYRVRFDPVVNANIPDPGYVVATINDNDDAPTARIANAPDVTEGGKATFAVTIDAASQRPVRVNFQTANGTAFDGADYQGVAPGAVLTFDPGQPLTKNIEVQTVDDTQSEGDETFDVLLTGSPDGSALMHATQKQATAKIKDNDAQRSISITGAAVTEGDGGTVNLDFKVKLSGTTSQRVEVTAVTQDGSAVSGSDYQFKSLPIVWAPNTPADELEKTFRVLINGDGLDEPQETFTVRLEAPQNATIAPPGTATGTINDNDTKSLLSISDAEANEGSAGATGAMTFKITLAPASARSVSVGWGTANGTATAGQDYTAASGTVTFAPGETSKDVTVPILGDDVNEPNETVLVNLSNVGGAGVADAQGQGTIVDKNAPPSLSIDDPLAREGEGATFTVTLAGTTLQEVRVTFSTADGTAKDGSDYSARRDTLVFAPGQKTKTVSVTVLDDTVAEGAETFTVTLGNPVNAAITKAAGTATIEASDVSGTPQGNQAPQQRPADKPFEVPKPKSVKKSVVYPAMVIGPRVATVTKGQARMVVTCRKNSKIACAGTVALQTAKKPIVKLGQKVFKVKKGKKASVLIKLSPKSMALLRKTGTMQVRVIVFVKTSAKKPLRVVPGVITIKLANAAASTTSGSP